MERYEHTRFMSAAFRSGVEELSALYCREDARKMIGDIKKAPEEARLFLRSDLEQMCRALGLDAQQLLREPKLLDGIPTREQLQEKLLELIYELHKKVPTSGDYMERIVRRLAPEYSQDTIRVAILKKFLLGAGWSCKALPTETVLGWLQGALTAQEQTLDDAKKLELLVQKADESLFAPERMRPRLSDREVLHLMLRRLENLRKNDTLMNTRGEEITCPEFVPEQDALAAMGEFCAKNGIAVRQEESAEALLRRIPEAAGEKLPFVSKLERDFFRMLAGIRYRKKSGALGKASELYENDRSDGEKKKSSGVRILTLCDDLAKGRFKTNNGGNRVNLYYFAIMFGMTVALRQEDIFDAQSDMVKNLFQDYYGDNLIRFLRGDYADPAKASFFETDITGEGINYKNYQEALYLYYLYRSDLPLTPGQRIDAAEKRMEECKRLARKKGTVPPEIREAGTELYRRRYIEEMIDLEEKALAEYVTENFLVLAQSGQSGIQVSGQQHTAGKRIGSLLDYLEECADVSAGLYERYLDKPGEKDIREEVRFASQTGFVWKLTPLLQEKYPQDADFLRMIQKLDQRLRDEGEWIGQRKKRFLMHLLRLLYRHSGEAAGVKLDKLERLFLKEKLLVNGEMVSQGAKILAQMGFDVTFESLSGGMRVFRLGCRSYPDAQRRAVMRKVTAHYVSEEALVCPEFDQLLQSHVSTRGNVSRAAMLAAYAPYYASELLDEPGIRSFPELVRALEQRINPQLEEARFQSLSEKNILDIYVICSVYFYMLDIRSR